MQTFLPLEDFKESLSCLDNKRLGKQRVEAMQILSAIKSLKSNDLYTIKRGKKRKKGWLNHPCTKMWYNYETALKYYHDVAIETWVERGFRNNMQLFNVRRKDVNDWSKWLGDSSFHDSHKSNLLRKDKKFYSSYNWNVTDNLEYVWPS